MLGRLVTNFHTGRNYGCNYELLIPRLASSRLISRETVPIKVKPFQGNYESNSLGLERNLSECDFLSALIGTA